MKTVLGLLWCSVSWAVSYWFAHQVDSCEIDSAVRDWLGGACIVTGLNPFVVLFMLFVSFMDVEDGESAET